jgi:allantoinase
MIRLCEEFSCRTHIVHLSSAQSIEPIRQAKDRGLPLTVETAQHYLYFAAEEIGDGLPAFKCAPPIRERENNDKLWQALEDGIIDLVATDHSPAPPEMKQLASGDLTRAWGGISSIQLALPVLWTAAKKRGLTPPQLVNWLCKAPARLAGQSTRRGQIAAGYLADLVVWDPNASFRVDGKDLYHRHPLTPYQDRELLGQVHQTWLQGIKVFDSGVFTRPGQGRIILNGRHV